MDFYAFPRLEQVETGNEDMHHLPSCNLNLPSAGGLQASGNVEKRLKPLKIRTFQVSSAEDVRHALAKMLEEVGKL
jgi:hypothetical protein